MAELKLDLQDIDNCGTAIDRELERVIHEAVDKKVKEVEIIPGRGSGRIKPLATRSASTAAVLLRPALPPEPGRPAGVEW